MNKQIKKSLKKKEAICEDLTSLWAFFFLIPS